MRKEFTISVELDDELKEALYNIRWKHVDIDSLIQEELMEQVESLIRANGEGK